MWDTAFFTNKHKQTLGVDEAMVQQYFPMEHVKAETLRIYEELLCLRFERVADAQVKGSNKKCASKPFSCTLTGG